MQWSSYISATSTLANAAPWFTAMFDEFKIYLYIGAGVALAFGMIIVLVRVFKNQLHNENNNWKVNKKIPTRDFMVIKNGKTDNWV